MSDYVLKSKSNKFIQMLKFCEKVANTRVNVLLLGESGSGKEIAANYIHACSERNNKELVTINCSSYADTLLESELFGHEQGAFTGANKSRIGKLETANGGTLFLDEIGDIDLITQVKLLRVIESKKISKIGSNKENLIDFRLISATNKNLKESIRTQKYREDFLYRISTVVIEVPPLRERKEDLDILIDYFLKKSQEENNIDIKSIDSKVKKFLKEYNYPGNIRELKNIVERMVVLSENGVITEDGIPIVHSINESDISMNIDEFDKVIPLKEFQRASERKYIQWVLEKYHWNVAKSSRYLGISSRQLFNKINLYELRK